ncbi:MAG: hypothetical protein ACKVY0_16235 [Prosthecobacter sp.]|uniref:hypothetical protein n=1 Tax=Prosthecobacter sp. TaxID=1965333 RepID=UPI0038FD97DF
MRTNTNIGLWIDHRKAVIAFVSNLGEQLQVILSHADRQPGRINGKRSSAVHESLLLRADDVQDRKFGQHLNTYYDEIIACVHEAESLLIFGPGEAKSELGKRLARKKPAGRTLRVVAADKLTDQQIAAKARDYFKHAHRVFAF